MNFGNILPVNIISLLECKYDDVAFSDCDPIKLTKWREKHLIAGGAICQKVKNETKSCDVGDFPPGICSVFVNDYYFLISKQ